MDVPERFDNHQASILMKTGLHRIVGDTERICCYLDSDVVAVNSGVDRIFQRKRGPVTFAADHTRLPMFSRYAVRCSCVRGSCDHLRQAIGSKFGVDVFDPEWQHWNGGVFLFDSGSMDFLDTWHTYTRAIFDDPGWKTRDQGTLSQPFGSSGFRITRHSRQNTTTLSMECEAWQILSEFQRVLPLIEWIQPTHSTQPRLCFTLTFCISSMDAGENRVGVIGMTRRPNWRDPKVSLVSSSLSGLR